MERKGTNDGTTDKEENRGNKSDKKIIEDLCNGNSVDNIPSIKQQQRRMETQFVILPEIVEEKKGRLQIRQKHDACKKRKVKTWTVEEDKELINLYNNFPKKWATIAGKMNDRNENQCLHRFRRLSQIGAHRKIWSSEEDETISRLVKKYGKNWKLLSEKLQSKTGKQIRERFINKLDPKIKKEDWTDYQDIKILQLYSEIGRKWSEISKHLPGRPENKIKNRFYSFIQKNYQICFNLEKEDQQKKDVVKEQFIEQTQKLISLEQINIDLNHVQECLQKQTIPISKDDFLSILKIEDDWCNEIKYRNFDDFTGRSEEIQQDIFYIYQH